MEVERKGSAALLPGLFLFAAGVTFPLQSAPSR
jgi:hypothetical protein